MILIAGGFANRLYRLDTDQRSFAVRAEAPRPPLDITDAGVERPLQPRLYPLDLARARHHSRRAGAADLHASGAAGAAAP